MYKIIFRNLTRFVLYITGFVLIITRLFETMNVFVQKKAMHLFKITGYVPNRTVIVQHMTRFVLDIIVIALIMT